MSTSGAARSSVVSGTLAARPAAGIANRLYWATDVNAIYFDTGSFWNTMQQAGSSANALIDLGSFVAPTAAPAYSASITPSFNSGPWQTITVTNATAFTINAPTNAPTGAQSGELTVEIFNNSGGVMGAITWNAIFKLVGGAFTNPANTLHRFIRFEWNGANWIETSRASADY